MTKPSKFIKKNFLHITIRDYLCGIFGSGVFDYIECLIIVALQNDFYRMSVYGIFVYRMSDCSIFVYGMCH